MKMKKGLLLNIVCILTSCAPSHEVIVVTPQEEKSAQLLNAQGVFALQKRDLTKAESLFSLSREIVQSAESLDGLGCVAFERGEYEEAKDFFSEARRVNPQYARVLGNAARVYEKTGDYEVALRLYQRALVERPGDSEVRNNYGAFLVEYDGKPAMGEFEIIKASHLKNDLIIESNIRILEREF